MSKRALFIGSQKRQRENIDDISDSEGDSPVDDSLEDVSYSPGNEKIVATIGTVKRACTQTQLSRFGTTENDVDHNSFFESVAVTNQTLVSTNTHSSVDTDIRSPGNANQKDGAAGNSNVETYCTKSTESLLKTLIAKVDALQKQMIRIEVKIDSIDDNGEQDPTGVVNAAKLVEIGLPVKTEEELATLEDRLSDISKRTDIVSFNLEI